MAKKPLPGRQWWLRRVISHSIWENWYFNLNFLKSSSLTFVHFSKLIKGFQLLNFFLSLYHFSFFIRISCGLNPRYSSVYIKLLTRYCIYAFEFVILKISISSQEIPQWIYEDFTVVQDPAQLFLIQQKHFNVYVKRLNSPARLWKRKILSVLAWGTSWINTYWIQALAPTSNSTEAALWKKRHFPPME